MWSSDRGTELCKTMQLPTPTTWLVIICIEPSGTIRAWSKQIAQFKRFAAMSMPWNLGYGNLVMRMALLSYLIVVHV